MTAATTRSRRSTERAFDISVGLLADRQLESNLPRVGEDPRFIQVEECSNPYAASKAAADIALGEMALRGLRALRMRPFNQVGPGQTEAFAVPAFARQIARIEAGQQDAVIRTGALDRWRDMLDVRDVCAGYAAAIERGDQIEQGAAINLASGQPRRIGDILEELIALAGIAVRIETDPGRLRQTDVETTRGDARRAAEWLGWVPSIPWERTIADVLEDWRRRIAALARC